MTSIEGSGSWVDEQVKTSFVNTFLYVTSSPLKNSIKQSLNSKLEIKFKIIDENKGTWTPQAGTGYYRFTYTLANANPAKSRTICRSNMFKYTSATVNVEGICFVYGNQLYVYPPSNVTTAAQMKELLAEHNLVVQYPLDTPEEEEITDSVCIDSYEELLKAQTYEGITHVTADGKAYINLDYWTKYKGQSAYESVEEIENSVNNLEANVESRLDEVNASIETAQSTIDQLSNMISHLITDENGGSLMTQTTDGWTFNMSSISGNLNAIKDAMVDMENNQNGTNSALEKLTDLVNSVANKTAYITMATDDNGDPCIELGKSGNPFKVRITNTAIDFLEGSTRIAYANNNTFYVEKMIVKKEIQIGEGPGFVWRTRENGNMGLVWISG